MSSRALLYMDDPLSHRFIFISEAPGHQDTDGKLRAFGFSALAPGDAQKAARLISENKDTVHR
jgi:hypothetical protein